MPTINIDNFTGGINDARDPSLIGDQDVVSALNVRPTATNDIESRGGQTLLTTAVASPQPVNGAIQVTLSTGVVRDFITVSDNFYYLVGDTPTQLSTTGVTNNSGALWRFVFFNDLIIGANRAGILPIKWDGNPANNVQILGGLPASVSNPTDVTVWNSRLCLAQDREIFISDADEAEDWKTGDSAILRFSGTAFGEERINAIATFRGKLIVFKVNSVWEVNSGSGVSDSWEIKLISNNIGCDAPFSIQDVGRDLIFHTQGGWASLSDLRDRGGISTEEFVSRKIENTIQNQLNTARIDKIVSEFNPEKGEYMCAISTGVNTTNDKVVILNITHTLKNQGPSWWVYEYDKQVSYFYRRPSVVEDTLYAGSTDSIIYQLNVGSQDAGMDFNKSLKTKRYNFEKPYDNKLFNRIFVGVFQQDNFNIGVTTFFDQGRRSKGFNINLTQNSFLWDVGLWDQAIWAGIHLGNDRRALNIMSRDLQLEFVNSAAGGTLGIQKITVVLDLLDDDQQADLNT